MMRAFWLIPIALLLAAAGPAAAQDAAPRPDTTPGLVIVGHGPDVPNVAQATADACAAPQPGVVCGVGTPALDDADVAAPPVVVMVAPMMGVGVQAPLHRSGGGVRGHVGLPRHSTGQFVNDPSRRFVNPIVTFAVPHS